MNRKLKQTVVAAALSTVVLLSACAKPAATAAPLSDQTAQQVKAVKFSEPVQLTIGRATHSGLTFEPGESYDKNSVYDAYEKNLGIKLKNLWVVDAKQYDQKVQASIASNDLPELMEVNAVQLQQMVKSDELMDMTQMFDKYATQETKDFFNGSITKKQLETAKFDGKLMAFPFTDSPYNFSWYLYVRKDWLEKLQLPEPKTMQDVESIAKVFADKKPGGAAKTYGITLTKDLYSDAYGLIPFFNGYHAYPQQWIKDPSGKLAYGSIQPEMKTALQHLQDMYKAGLIDPEFAVKDPGKENELVANNQLGIAFGKFWLSSYPLKQAAIKNGKAEQVWGTYPLPSIDDKPAMVQIPLGINGYYVVSKKAKHPEAVMALVNKRVKDMITQSKGDIPDSEKVYTESASGNYMYSFLEPVVFYNPEDRLNDGKIFPKAIQNSDPSVLPKNQVGQYNNVQDYLNKGKAEYWNSWMQTQPGGSLSIMYQYSVDNRYLFDEFSGVPTPTMAQKQTTLQAMEQEQFTKIIMNQASVDEFDNFVKSWKSLGGDAMTKEMNDGAAKSK